MGAKIVPPAWPARESVYVHPQTARPGLHDPYTNPYVGWVVANGDREFERTREVHQTKRDAQQWAEERYAITAWVSVNARSTFAAVPKKESTDG